MQINHTFALLSQYLSERRDLLLSQVARVTEGYFKNLELDRAIHEMMQSRDQLIATMTSNLNVSSLDTHKLLLERDIEMKMAEKVPVGNLEFVGFRCYSEKIRKAINEIDLYDLSPEYVGRENPFLTACYEGSDDGELFNPRGIALDRARNEVYVCDSSNSRIQVFSPVRICLRTPLGEKIRICSRNSSVIKKFPFLSIVKKRAEVISCSCPVSSIFFWRIQSLL